MAAQMSEENARDNEIFEAIANALQALNNLTMIKTMADCAADALAAGGLGVAAPGRAAPGRHEASQPQPEPVRRRSAGATGDAWRDYIDRRERSLIRSISHAVGQTLGKDVIALEQRCAALETELAELRDPLNQERGQRGLRAVPMPSAPGALIA